MHAAHGRACGRNDTGPARAQGPSRLRTERAPISHVRTVRIFRGTGYATALAGAGSDEGGRTPGRRSQASAHRYFRLRFRTVRFRQPMLPSLFRTFRLRPTMSSFRGSPSAEERIRPRLHALFAAGAEPPNTNRPQTEKMMLRETACNRSVSIRSPIPEKKAGKPGRTECGMRRNECVSRQVAPCAARRPAACSSGRSKRKPMRIFRITALPAGRIATGIAPH